MAAFETLAALAANRSSGVYLARPARDAEIAAMQTAAERDLGGAVPEAYVALLRVSDGVQIGGAYFKSASNLVPENLDDPRTHTIVLGNAGNISEYVFDRRDGRFHAINMGGEDERIASFESFEALLLAVMKDQHVP